MPVNWNTIGLIIVGLLAAYTAWTNREAARERSEMMTVLKETHTAVNSANTAALATQALASEAKGRDDMRHQKENEAAALAKGADAAKK